MFFDIFLLILAVAIAAALPMPQGGSVGVGVHRDGYGTTGTLQYNQNLWQGNKGNSRLDAYAQASKNFNHHGKPSYGGGINFSHRF